MHKQTRKNPVQSYILAIKSMSLASGMMVFSAACDSIKKWPEVQKDNLRELIKRIKNTSKKIINLEN